MSLILDLIFPRPYDTPNFYHPVFPQAIKYFPTHFPDTCLSLFKYTGTIRRTILDLKYDLVSDASFSLASLAAAQIKKNFPHLLAYWRQNKFIFVPIPLHPRRFNWRGFNQADAIGRPLALKLKLSFVPVLLRTRHTLPQVSFPDKRLRSRNLQKAFSTISSPPDNIILFDDVATTYSTLRSAAAVLKKSGAKSVFGLTIAG